MTTGADSSIPSCPSCGATNADGARYCTRCGTHISVPDAGEDERWRGQTIGGRYCLRRKIGRGAMGTVFEAEHVRLQKRVAIKMLHPNLQLDEQSMRRFQQEGVAAGRLRHPGVVQVFDFDRAESGSFYMAMEFVDGVTLRERMKQGPMDPAVAVALARAVLEVLAAAHREGVVHRDLKPENVLVVETPPDPPQVKLLDFGISKLMDLHNENTELTHTGQILGTPLYMAPEQWTGETVDARADLYALAAILFEMVSGAPLFQGRNLTELLGQHTQEAPPLLSERCPGREVPRDLERVLALALAKLPAHRFSDASSMNQALARIDWQRAAGRGWLTRGARAVRRRPLAAAAGLLVALAIGTGIWFLAGRGGEAAAKAQPSRVRLAARSKESLTPDERLDLAALERARGDVERGDARAVLSSLRELMQRPDPDAEAFLLRGQAYALLRDPETARKDLEQVLALDSEWPQAHCALARLDFDLGRIEPARTGYERAKATDPRCAEAWLGLAEIALRQEMVPTALSAATTARELDPDDPRALLILGQATLRSGDLDGAGDLLIEAKRRQPGSAPVHLELARLYTARSDLVQAERELREARSLDPANVAATLELSALLLGREQYSDARFMLVDALSLGTDSADLRAALALAHDGGGDRDSAIHEMRRALQQGGSGGAGRWSLLGSWLSERGEFDAAIDAFQSALIVDDEYAPAHRELGALYLRQERFDEARDQLIRSLEIAEDRETYFLLGVLEWEYAGDHEAALLAFDRYRQLGGTHPRVQMELDRVSR